MRRGKRLTVSEKVVGREPFLDFVFFAATLRALPEYRQHNHHNEQNKGHYDGEFDERKQETKHHDKLPQQSYDKQDGCYDTSEAKGFSYEGCHFLFLIPNQSFNADAVLSQDRRSNGSGPSSRPGGCAAISPARNAGESKVLTEITEGGGCLESKRTTRSDPRRRRR
jgi:hypothetical protein